MLVRTRTPFVPFTTDVGGDCGDDDAAAEVDDDDFVDTKGLLNVWITPLQATISISTNVGSESSMLLPDPF